MIEFFQDLLRPELAFLRYALLIGILAGPALGVVGTMVVTRRISSLAGASAHAALGGMGLALYLQRAELLRGADDGLVLSVVRGMDIDGNEIFNFVWTNPGTLVTERQIDDAFDNVFGTTAP